MQKGATKMPYRIMLLHIGDKDEENMELIRLMRSGASSAADGTGDIIIPGTPLQIHISDATLKVEQSKPCIFAKPGSGAGAILIYDTTRRETFAECMGWIDAFKSYATREAVVLLLANRRKKLQPITVFLNLSHEHSKNRVVPEEEGERFAKNVGALYCEAKTQSPNTAKQALFHIVMQVNEKLKNGTLGTGPNQGIKLIPVARRYSTNSFPDGEPRVYKQNLPKVVKLESELSFAEEEVKRMRQTCDVEKARQDSLQQQEKQLALENSMLRQELDHARREVKKLNDQNTELNGQNTALQRMCSALEQENCQLSAIQKPRQDSQQQEKDLMLENSTLRQELDGKTFEVGKLNDENATLQQMCTALQQENTLLKQENSGLSEALRSKTHESVAMQQQLQYQLRLKEDAFQNETRLRAESNAALFTAMAENHSLKRQKTSEIDDHWKVSRHEIILKGENLGQGAWGYVAEGEFRGKRVAVKCLHEEIMTCQNLERVYREIRTMANVRHPNLVLFIAAVFDEGPPMIISELLDTNLRAAYENRQLNGTNTKIEILHGVACALNYLHKLREPIIHRDISAPNVLLKAAGLEKWTPKVSDFGSANLAQYSQTLGEGAIIYAAPETYPQSLHSVIHTTKIDVYSYGVLVGEVFTEQLPDPDTLFYTLQHIEAQWPHIHRLMVKCTKQNPEERPDMATVITEYLGTF